MVFHYLRLRIDFGINPWFRQNQAAFATALIGRARPRSLENLGSILIMYNNSYLCLECFYNFSGIIGTLRTESRVREQLD